MGLGKAPAITALVLYSLLILVRNIAIGIREVPAELIEAADGMGYGKGRRLLRIELPMALPVIVAGIRITVVTQIAVATVPPISMPEGWATSSSRASPRISARRSRRRRAHLPAGDRRRRIAEGGRAAPARRYLGAPLMRSERL